MSTLEDKLKSLGVKIGARDLPPPQPRQAAYAVERVLPGQFQATPQGEVFVVESSYALDHRHGQTELQLTAPRHTVAEWAGDRRVAAASPTALAFLDTETTGLAGGSGTYAFLIGVGRFEAERFRLAQFFMRDPAEEPAQLAALAEFLQGCEVLVTFNGKAFDAPLLNTRYIANGNPSPLPELAHLDLLPLARRLWRDRLPSRALGQLEQHILRASRTQEDIPGWLIPSVFFDYLRSGDARPLRGVFYHNAMDILAMAALLNQMSHMLADPLEGVEHAMDIVALARLFEALQQFELAARLYRHGLALDLPEENYWDTLQRLSLLHKRRGEWSVAVELWQQAAAGRQIYAHVELAKFYEHQTGDNKQAAQWTRAAMEIISAPTCPATLRRQYRRELEHRLARLNRKFG
ncbi:MAG: ribonuclease H-like domain-containing protein [Chloroflexota bacterium]